jgi:hypothetical protein
MMKRAIIKRNIRPDGVELYSRSFDPLAVVLARSNDGPVTTPL